MALQTGDAEAEARAVILATATSRRPVIIFDTPVLIAHLRGDECATQLLLKTATAERAASVLARTEI